LKVLDKIPNIKVNLVTTTANKNLKKLKKYCKIKNWIKLYINSNKIAKLMKKSDYGIITPSVTANEIYFLKTPFISIQTALNQKFMYKYLINNKMNVLKEFDIKKLKKTIKKLIK
jgi:spore coat polysaccharide biosynthesis predicted glycosyltransferase SpsG